MWGIISVAMVGAAVISGLGFLSVRADRQAREKKKIQVSSARPDSGRPVYSSNIASVLEPKANQESAAMNATAGVGQ
jgi:hypothetical protein